MTTLLRAFPMQGRTFARMSRTQLLRGSNEIRNFKTTGYLYSDEKRFSVPNQDSSGGTISAEDYKAQVQKTGISKPGRYATEEEKDNFLKAKIVPYLSAQENEEFFSEFPNVLRDLDTLLDYKLIEETKSWIKYVAEYNVLEGKHMRPAFFITMAKGIQKIQNGRELANLNRIAWTLDFVQANYNILDDIMDKSETRRNLKCWHLVDGIGLDAISDGIMLENYCFVLLKKYIRDLYPLYVDIIDLFLDIGLKSKIGECADMIITRAKTYDRFTRQVHEQVAHKTSYHAYCLPIKAALLLNNIKDESLFKQMDRVGLDLGMLLTVLDDFMDAFVDESCSGKAPTDIQDGKCNWLAVRALERANDVQKKVFEANYGSKDNEKVSRIKSLYKDLGIPELYFKEVGILYEELMQNIQDLPPIIPKEPLVIMADFLYKRPLKYNYN